MRAALGPAGAGNAPAPSGADNAPPDAIVHVVAGTAAEAAGGQENATAGRQ
jgi:hypothetical protein